MVDLLDLPDELLLLIRDFLPGTLPQHLTLSHVCGRFMHLSTEASWRTLLFRLRLGRPLCNGNSDGETEMDEDEEDHTELGEGKRLIAVERPGKKPTRPGWRELALILLKHGATCQRAGCKGGEWLDTDMTPDVPLRMEDVITDSSVFRFHPLHFTVHGHPQSTPPATEGTNTPAPTPAAAPDAPANTQPGPDGEPLPIPIPELPAARESEPAYSLILSRVLQAHLPFPSWRGRSESNLMQFSARYGPTQRYAPLCQHPNASCVFATAPPARELRLPFRLMGERRIVEVRNAEGVTLLDLSRALVDTLLAEPDDMVYSTVMETYGAKDDVVSFGLVQALRDRGFMNDHEWPLIELLDEYDYGEVDWDGYSSWVDNVRGTP